MNESIDVAESPSEQVEQQSKSARRNKVAEEKARLREELAALVNKVPARVNGGSIQTTREWVADNKVAGKSVTRKRISRRALEENVRKMREWRAEAQC